MKILKAVLLVAVLALVGSVVTSPVASAADITGAWSGTFKITMPDGQTRDDSVHLVLKQDGGKITGTAGPGADQQMPIAKGTIEGNKVMLEVPVPDGVFKFDIALEGDHLKGDVTRSMGDQSVKAKMDATRAK